MENLSVHTQGLAEVNTFSLFAVLERRQKHSLWNNTFGPASCTFFSDECIHLSKNKQYTLSDACTHTLAGQKT